MLAAFESLLNGATSPDFGPRAYIHGWAVELRSNDPVFRRRQFVHRALTVNVLSARAVPGRTSTWREDEKTGSMVSVESLGLSVTPENR